jgi:hypothetical protein
MTGTIACLLLSVAALAPQDPDRDLASALVERGWVDLAEEMVLRAGSTLGEDAYTRALIASAKAREETSVERAVLALEIAIERFSKGGRTLTSQDRSMIGSLHVQKAMLLSDVTEGPQAWTAAETYYRAAITAVSKMTSTPDQEELLLDLRLELPRVLAARAKLPSVGEAPRKALLEESVRLLQDFQFDTGDRPIAFEALLEEGRVRVEMKDYARALRCFQAVLNVKKKGAALKGYPAALWDAAFLGQVRALTLAGKAKDAAAQAGRFLKDNPERARSPMGITLLLLQAEALHGAGDDVGALLLAQKVAGLNPDGAAGRSARERIREWMKGAQATPDRMLLVAEGLIDQGRYRDALVDLRRCVEICAGEPDRTKFEPLAAFKRGECFRALKQEEEASVAFQDVYRKYPQHDLARRAAFEAVRSLSAVTTATRDPRDQDRQEQLLKEISRLGLQGVFAPFFKFLEAEILERKGQWKAAADLYRQVDESCEVYNDALVSAGHCYRRAAESTGTEEAARDLKQAEELLRRALGRLEKVPDSRLLPTTEFELASVCLSSALYNPKDALMFVDRCAKRLSAEHELQARLGEMALRAHLALEDLPAAVDQLEKLLKAFPDHASAARAAKRVALREEASNPAAALKYYHVWLDRTESAGAPTGDVQSVAEGLYRTARTLNRFDDRIVSVVDLRENPILDQGAWKEVARALERLLAAPDLSAKDRVSLQARLAWSLGLAAQSADEWSRLKKHCEGLIESYKLVNANGELDPKVLQAQRWLAGIYLEYGHALYQLGRLGQKFQFSSASRVFKNLSAVTGPGSEPWWISKWMGLKILFERGEGDDLPVAGAALSLIERNYPEFDGGKYGIRDLLAGLKRELNAVLGTQR